MIAKYAIALLVVILLAAAFAWAFLPARYLPGNRARHLRIRLHLCLHPGKGFAHVFSLWLRWGRFAALRRSARIRAALPLWYRIAEPHQHSVFLGRAHYRHGLRVPLEEHLLVMAPPRTYKTAFLADVILRYPGPVIATTTKADIYGLTAAVRAQHGRVHVFNPQHIGGVASTFCWNPVAGCEDPATAIRRADAFAFAVSQKGVEDATFWSAKASDYLRGYFCAAALARYDLRSVAAWVAGAEPDVPERILLAAGARQWAHTLAELRSEAHKTAATVRMVMSRALSFMADPALAASVLPGPGDGFDIPAFLDGTGTVYLIAEAVSEEAPVAPLFAAMATEIHYIAAQLGQASSSGRLDPPLLMGLDEVTQICPVPLPFWLSDSGGKGIQVCAVVHGEAQLAERWGNYGRQVVLDTSSVKVFLPGITDVTTLQAASTLCGQASWKVRGQDHATRHDVATPDMIRQLPAGFALVIRGGCAPVIARLPARLEEPRLPPRPPPRPGPVARHHRAPRGGARARHPRLRARRMGPRRRHLLPVELTMPGTDPITAIVDQLAAHAEQLTRLDTREADHHAAASSRLADLADQAASIGRVVQEHAAALGHLTAPSQTDRGADGYQPDAAPAWWKLTDGDRQEPLTRLRAWVEQVYRPGYGHLAAGLGPCWPSHDLCLYGLDILSELWSVLYLQPARTPGLVSAQAEYQARILPALAGQLRAETNTCSHPRNPAPADGRPWSRP